MDTGAVVRHCGENMIRNVPPMKIVMQSESSECGLACLAMVSAFHGLWLDLSDLRRRFCVSIKGATLATLMRHAEVLGLSGRPLRLELHELRDLRMPCILHWGMSHFVVLKGVSRHGAVILDPAVGELKLPFTAVSKHFTGVALELFPTTSFRPADERRHVRLHDLTGRVLGLRRSLVQVFLLALGLEVFALTAPLFNQFVVDEVVVTADRELLHVLAVGFGLLLMIQTAIALLRSWIVMRIAQDVRLQWTSSLFAHMVRLPADFFAKRHLGDVLSRFGSITAMQDTLTTAVITAVLDGLMAVLAIIVLLAYSLPLTAVVIGSVTIYGLLRWISFQPFRDASQDHLVAAAKESSYFLETLRAIVPLKLAGHESQRRARWQNLYSNALDREIRMQQFEILFTSATTFVSGIGTLLVLLVGARLVIDATMTVGMLMAFSSYAGTFVSRVNSLIGYMARIKMLGLHAERVADIALEPPEGDPEIETDIDRLAFRIELRNVSFRYAEGEAWILRNVSLTVEEGESIAIVGASGCGKTTLLKIILGLLEPTEGKVLLGGVPVAQIGWRAYRSRIAAVLQDDVLLSGSIFENIAMFDPHADANRVEACARVAAIHEEISKMPMGYQTLVGDMGTALSGGQKQRVLLARALYRQPKVLVLDEATSHLDAANEKAISCELAKMPVTRIVVAHRQETVVSMGRIVQLARENGQRSSMTPETKTLAAEEFGDAAIVSPNGAQL